MTFADLNAAGYNPQTTRRSRNALAAAGAFSDDTRVGDAATHLISARDKWLAACENTENKRTAYQDLERTGSMWDSPKMRRALLVATGARGKAEKLHAEVVLALGGLQAAMLVVNLEQLPDITDHQSLLALAGLRTATDRLDELVLAG